VSEATNRSATGVVGRIAAIVPATDGPATLATALDAIRAAADPPDELIVVDGPTAAGAAAARNAGADRATSDVLVFVDADVAVHADAFRRIRAHFDADPELTAVFGSYDDAPAARGIVSVFRNLLHHHVHQQSGGPATTFWAGLGAIRREAFLSVAGFDEQRFRHASIEDIDLGMRLAAHGGRIVLDPEIQGTHLKAWTLESMLVTDFAHRGVPWVLLLLRRRAVPSSLNLGWQHRLSAASCVVVCGALATRRYGVAAAAGAGFVALNRSFYRLLLRKQGARGAALGVGLHALHHLAGAAAVPVGIVVFLRRRRND
jgi:glycosyltransferase involved in cell wall biosynthesis